MDIPFPKKERDEIVANGEAESHHILPEKGWVSFYVREAGDIDRAIDLTQTLSCDFVETKEQELIRYQISAFQCQTTKSPNDIKLMG